MTPRAQAEPVLGGVGLGVSGEAEVEASLVERLRAKDPDAYVELLKLLGGRMLAVARRMLNNEEDARDAVQEAMLACCKHIDTFDGRSQVGTWLHRIVVNACLMKRRSRSRRPERSIEDLLPTFVEDGHQTRSSSAWVRQEVGGGGSGDELRLLVRRRIDELPEGYREVLLLRDIAGLSTEAAAEVLGMKENAVKTRLHRARQALRALLDPAMRGEEAQ
ncbi:MAG: sigma-70 family RNA polymerase sigma factor [Phycisphaerales bacterium]|nr:sigma-70 family RNA polymerase sigma factor [Phycisphaerales bacterium]